MTQTEHFELNIVEGTDIVNPLVIDNPNYEKIDAQMFANQNGTVGTATELTSNTIHALTRANGNTNMFRFTATSNYNLGDTFTVDGVNVTALLPNGKALGDRAYIIGGTVLCSLVGTLLTIYTFAVAEADDSAKLGGELPSYYATKAEVDNAQSLAEGGATIAQDASAKISALEALLDRSGSHTIYGIVSTNWYGASFVVLPFLNAKAYNFNITSASIANSNESVSVVGTVSIVESDSILVSLNNSSYPGRRASITLTATKKVV